VKAVVLSPFAVALDVTETPHGYTLQCRACGAAAEAPKLGVHELTLAHEDTCPVWLAMADTAGSKPA
jgi:hypothetical protein